MKKMFRGGLTKKFRCMLIRFRNKSYYLTRKAKYLEVSKLHKPDRETVVIYQMGKVGSSSVKYSLSKLDRPMNLYHVHALTKERIDWQQQAYRNASRIRGKAVIHSHLVEGIFLRKELDRNPNQHWKIITLVRDPIARNISTFFQSLDILFPEWVKEHNIDKDNLVDHVKEMIELFLSKADHKLPLVWFDKLLKPVFNINVFDQKFPVSKGYEIYKNDKVELLLIKLEDLDRCASNAFKEFLGIENFALVNANITSEKADSKAYAEFKKLIRLPDSYIDEMYSSQLVQHFYTQSEIDRLKTKWR
ncbi:MAG: putative capsular polysaccharide synthesis family protein, partial [Gammaproteobacteria bacterium]